MQKAGKCGNYIQQEQSRINKEDNIFVRMIGKKTLPMVHNSMISQAVIAPKQKLISGTKI